MPLIINTNERYSWLAIVMHWAVAVIVVGLFWLGWWMVELDYYSKWYKVAPDIHRSVGILLVVGMLLRMGLRLVSGQPGRLPSIGRWEHRLARSVHALLYLLVFAICAAGYLISTADGRPIDVFGWFDVPATLTAIPNQEDVMGDLHLVLAVVVMALAALHSAAALKHHFVDRDATLMRMFGLNRREKTDEFSLSTASEE